MDALLLQTLSYAGVAVFAATGAIAAARLKQDIVTFMFFAALTGVGGGTLRDLLLGAPVFWRSEPAYVLICVATGAVVWVLGRRAWHETALLWLDAVGLGAFAVIGAEKALNFGESPVVAVVMGVLTIAGGGMIRDVLAGEPSIFLRREIYVTAGIFGAVAFIAAQAFAPTAPFAGIVGFACGFGLRALALVFHWALPPFSGGFWGRDKT